MQLVNDYIAKILSPIETYASYTVVSVTVNSTFLNVQVPIYLVTKIKAIICTPTVQRPFVK